MSDENKVDEDRRRFLLRCSAAAVAVGATGLAGGAVAGCGGGGPINTGFTASQITMGQCMVATSAGVMVLRARIARPAPTPITHVRNVNEGPQALATMHRSNASQARRDTRGCTWRWRGEGFGDGGVVGARGGRGRLRVGVRRASQPRARALR